MAISPTGNPPPVIRLRPQQKVSDQDGDRATREAQQKIDASEKRVQQAETEANTTIEHLRDDSSRQVEAENIRQEAAIEGEKNRGYAALRELQQAQQKELNRVRREGERELQQLRSYYRDTIYGTERQGNQDLKELEGQQTKEREFAERSHDATMKDSRSQHEFDTERLKQEQEKNFHDLEASSRQEYDRYRVNTEEAKKRAQTEFMDKYNSVKAEHDAVQGDMNDRANYDIWKTRRDTATKLASYNSRQDDTFYKLVDIDARFSDDGDAFVLKATIPEHERDHLSVAVHGNEVVLSGVRRNEEKLDLGPGRSKATNSYQSYHETFGIHWPVDTKAMTKTFDGDELIVRLPKRSMQAEPLQRDTPKPEKARLERPKFPSNLALSKYQEEEKSPPQADLNPPSSDGSNTPRKRGTRTLA